MKKTKIIKMMALLNILDLVLRVKRKRKARRGQEQLPDNQVEVQLIAGMTETKADQIMKLKL